MVFHDIDKIKYSFNLSAKEEARLTLLDTTHISFLYTPFPAKQFDIIPVMYMKLGR